jgi:hypothetical protein
MTTRIATLAAVLACIAPVASAQNLGLDGKPVSPEAEMFGKATAACALRQASLLDDLKSDARTIADAIEGACAKYEGAFRDATLAQCPPTLSISRCIDIDAQAWGEQRLQIVLQVRAWRAAHPGKTPPWASAAAAAACPHPDAC